jgi:hypothetical protein
MAVNFYTQACYHKPGGCFSLFSPAAAWYATIICVRFFRAERGKTAHQQQKVPLCRRRKKLAAYLYVVFTLAERKTTYKRRKMLLLHIQ